MNLDLQERIRKLNQIGIALSGETNLERLLELVVSEARRFTSADAGSLYIRHGDGLRFEVAQNDSLGQSRGGWSSGFKPAPLPLTRTSIAGYIALTGEVLNIEDVYQLDDNLEYSFNRQFDLDNSYRSKSMLAVPMFDHRHGITGVLQLINALDDNRKVIPFSKDVEELALSLASQAAVAVSNAQLIQEIKNVFAALVRYSTSAIDARSPHTAGHSMRVAEYASMLARAVNQRKQGRFADIFFTADELEELSYAAWLHDIGKIGVREHVLEKCGKLCDDRMGVIRTRFENMRMSLLLNHQRQLLEMYSNGGPDREKVITLEEEKERQLSALDDDLAFLDRINQPGFLNDEDLARLQNLAGKQWLDPQGRPQAMLNDFEYENLSVRKGNLTADEYRDIQSHVVLTRKIVENIPFTPELRRIPEFAASHHEMLDGSGYPRGLKGDEIPLQARILGIVDIFDALAAKDRPYKKAMPVERAFEILRDEAARGRLDSDLVEIFIKEHKGLEQMARA